MDENKFLTINTKPGDVIDIMRWNDGKLEPFQNINHERNIGALILPPGHYVYTVIAEVGEYKQS